MHKHFNGNQIYNIITIKKLIAVNISCNKFKDWYK